MSGQSGKSKDELPVGTQRSNTQLQELYKTSQKYKTSAATHRAAAEAAAKEIKAALAKNLEELDSFASLRLPQVWKGETRSRATNFSCVIVDT